MGLYDSVHVWLRCPKCNGSVEEFQTKAFDGRCCRQFNLAHEHNALCKKTKKIMNCGENSIIPLGELTREVVSAGYFVAYTSCRSPECEWDAMRQNVLWWQNNSLPYKLKVWKDDKIPVESYSGRELEIKVYFNRKTGRLLRARIIPHDDPTQEELAKAVDVLAKNSGTKWTDALAQTGDTYLAMRLLAKNR